ncbi:unnamed protein product, partial [Coffea canephora]
SSLGYKIKYHANGQENDPIEIDFTPPFRRIDMIDELEKMANLNIPKDLSSVEANKYLLDACAKFDIKCPPPQTTARLLDKVNTVSLHGHYAATDFQLSCQKTSGMCAFHLLSHLTYLLHALNVYSE